VAFVGGVYGRGSWFVQAYLRALAAGEPPRLNRLDEATLGTQLPPMAATFFAADMPHSNHRLRQLGFSCRYPTVREGLSALDLSAPARG
jgi:hypothetical protein